jgi:hypothetical protein
MNTSYEKKGLDDNNLIIDNSENMDDNSDEDFVTINQMADNQKLVNCYQMQVDDNNECFPVQLGWYPDVPLPVNRIIKYKKYMLHLVTYVLTEDEIQNKLFKIVGVNVFRANRKNSLCSLDFVKNEEQSNYQLLFNDHKNNTTKVVENVEKFPGKDRVLEYVFNKVFETPVKSILIK